MSIVGGGSVSANFVSKNYENIRPLNDDKSSSESLIGGLMSYLKIDDSSEYNKSHAEALIGTLTQDHCEFALLIIKTNHTIVVVENKINHHKASNKILTFWERELNINSEELLGIMNDDKMKILAASHKTSVNILTVSKMAFDALNRYAKYLAEPPKIVQAYSRSLKENQRQERMHLLATSSSEKAKKDCCILL